MLIDDYYSLNHWNRDTEYLKRLTNGLWLYANLQYGHIEDADVWLYAQVAPERAFTILGTTDEWYTPFWDFPFHPAQLVLQEPDRAAIAWAWATPEIAGTHHSDPTYKMIIDRARQFDDS